METIDFVKANKIKADEIAKLVNIITVSQKAQVEHQRELRGTLASKTEEIKKNAEPITTELKKVNSLSEEETKLQTEEQFSLIRKMLTDMGTVPEQITIMFTVLKEVMEKINSSKKDIIKKKYLDSTIDSVDTLINNYKLKPISPITKKFKIVVYKVFLNEDIPFTEADKSLMTDIQNADDGLSFDDVEKLKEEEKKTETYDNAFESLVRIEAVKLYGKAKTEKQALINIKNKLNNLEKSNGFKFKEDDRNYLEHKFLNDFKSSPAGMSGKGLKTKKKPNFLVKV